MAMNLIKSAEKTWLPMKVEVLFVGKKWCMGLMFRRAVIILTLGAPPLLG
jgi:hypothetical protein